MIFQTLLKVLACFAFFLVSFEIEALYKSSQSFTLYHPESQNYRDIQKEFDPWIGKVLTKSILPNVSKVIVLDPLVKDLDTIRLPVGWRIASPNEPISRLTPPSSMFILSCVAISVLVGAVAFFTRE